MDRVMVECDGHPEVATIEALGADFLEQWKRLWRGRMAGEEDNAWDWHDILNAECSEAGGYAHHGLKLRGLWQGVMITRPEAEIRLGGPGARGVYIAYLAAAPWNRKRLRERITFAEERVAPVGRWLMWRALNQSHAAGRLGRTAWHSLPGALTDYMRMVESLTNMGPDEDDENGLPWLEVQPAAATTFLARAVLSDGIHAFTGR